MTQLTGGMLLYFIVAESAAIVVSIVAAPHIVRLSGLETTPMRFTVSVLVLFGFALLGGVEALMNWPWAGEEVDRDVR